MRIYILFPKTVSAAYHFYPHHKIPSILFVCIPPNTLKRGGSFVILEEHRGQGVLALLEDFGLHARDCCLEEESDKVLVCALSTNLLEGRDIGCAIFEADDKQRMVCSKKYEV